MVIFDILTRPAPELNAAERAELKKVAKDLLEKLKPLLVLNWRQTVTARSRVKLTIEDMLDQGLPRAYNPDLHKQKCSAVFEHVYEVYGDKEASSYRSYPGLFLFRHASFLPSHVSVIILDCQEESHDYYHD
jgi:type I restriction enzyme R subunit